MRELQDLADGAVSLGNRSAVQSCAGGSGGGVVGAKPSGLWGGGGRGRGKMELQMEDIRAQC